MSDLNLTFGTLGTQRFYRVRGAQQNTPDRLKVTIKVWLERDTSIIHADQLDLSFSRARGVFVSDAARELGVSEAIIKGDIAKVFGASEDARDAAIAEREKPKAKVVAMSTEDQEKALAFLKSPGLLENIQKDFETCGIVGESTNLLVAYLAATSRLLPKPLAVVVQSSSAAGKSSLVEAVQAMMPPEALVSFSSMTAQSLYYMGESLKHKILSVAEEEGAEDAAYALKLLQSEGKLSIATPSKDDLGRIRTERYEVEGGCSIFTTTTSIDIDEELLNRCLILSVNEDREQTQRIHALQRKAETLEGLSAHIERTRILSLHQNAQRLLEPIHVVNPYAEQLTFLDSATRTRRDHPKYLRLIQSIALLHQHQRKKFEHKGNDGAVIPYIEVSREDIQIANRLMGEILGRSLDDIPPQSRRLLSLIVAQVKEAAEAQGISPASVRFTRKQVRDWCGWTDAQVKRHLHILHDLEYLSASGTRCLGWSYELLYADNGATACPLGLMDAKNLAAWHPQSEASDPLGAPFAPPSGVGGASDVSTGKTERNRKKRPSRPKVVNGTPEVLPTKEEPQGPPSSEESAIAPELPQSCPKKCLEPSPEALGVSES